MNRVVIIGRLTKDVEFRNTTSGKGVASFTVAVDRPFRNANGEKEADFIPVIVFGKLAENCTNHIGKGRLVGVSGRIQVRNYEAKDGTRRYITEIVADTVQFLDWAKGDAYEPETEEPGGLPF
jgi:single-strand DNA-binding protein